MTTLRSLKCVLDHVMVIIVVRLHGMTSLAPRKVPADYVAVVQEVTAECLCLHRRRDAADEITLRSRHPTPSWPARHPIPEVSGISNRLDTEWDATLGCFVCKWQPPRERTQRRKTTCFTSSKCVHRGLKEGWRSPDKKQTLRHKIPQQAAPVARP